MTKHSTDGPGSPEKRIRISPCLIEEPGTWRCTHSQPFSTAALQWASRLSAGIDIYGGIAPEKENPHGKGTPSATLNGWARCTFCTGEFRMAHFQL